MKPNEGRPQNNAKVAAGRNNRLTWHPFAALKEVKSKRLPTWMITKSMLLAAGLWVGWPAWALDAGALAAETLSRQTIAVPDDLEPNAVLLLGFSREANAEVRPWWEALQTARGEHDFAPYSVSVIEGAPGFVQGMIRRAMRKRANASRKDYILLVTEGAEAWRSFLSAEDDAAAHVVRLRDGGGICLRRVGPLADDALQAIVSGECETGQPVDNGQVNRPR